MKGRPKNWSTHQHYRGRRPPWIKLHRALLDDPAWGCLQLASRALAPCLWLLASETDDGEIDLDPAKLAWRLRLPYAEVDDGLRGLLDGGWLEITSGCEPMLAPCKQDASIVLAPCKQLVPSETETETETEGEREAEAECAASASLARRSQNPGSRTLDVAAVSGLLSQAGWPAMIPPKVVAQLRALAPIAPDELAYAVAQAKAKGASRHAYVAACIAGLRADDAVRDPRAAGMAREVLAVRARARADAEIQAWIDEPAGEAHR